MGAMHNVMIFDDWIGEWENKDVKFNGEGVSVIEKQEINIVISFTLDGKTLGFKWNFLWCDGFL